MSPKSTQQDYENQNQPARSAENMSEPIARDVEAHTRAAEETSTKKVSYMSLPKKGQLAVLCIARLADPLAATSIQTYMFYQLRFFDPSASDALISTQAGIMTGAKTAAQVCTGMLWGRLADAEFGGRKAVLTIGLLSSGISCIGYGFSTTFLAAVAWQVFGGAMSSNVGITRCVVAELNPEKRYRTRALLLLPLFASAGMLIGPLVGGLLSSQTGNGVLKSYPYAPPNLFAATIYAVAALGVIFGLEETLEGFHHEGESLVQRLWRNITALYSYLRGHPTYGYSAINPDESEIHAADSDNSTPASPLVDLSSPSTSAPRSFPAQPPRPRPSKARLAFSRIWTFNVLCTMLAHFIIAGHLSTFTSLWAIFLSTPVASASPSSLKPEDAHRQQQQKHHYSGRGSALHFIGGVGMQPREVGFAMSALGAIGVVLQLVIYPVLNDRFGTIRIWRAALFVFPVVYAVAPFLSLVASSTGRSLSDSGSGIDALVWLAVGFVLLLFVIGRTGVTPATTLLINDCTPHPSVRGTIHTAGTVIGNLSRSLFPVVAFVVYAKGIDLGVVGLGFWALSGLAGLACVASYWVREGLNGKEIVLSDEERDTQEDLQTGNQNK